MAHRVTGASTKKALFSPLRRGKIKKASLTDKKSHFVIANRPAAALYADRAGALR
jgi:hypothetical protein